MEVQYNVPVKVLDSSKGYLVTHLLQGHRVFTDGSGNLDMTCISRETVPYVGDIQVVKTLKPEAARTAYDVLSGVEGLVVLPITEFERERSVRDS